MRATKLFAAFIITMGFGAVASAAAASMQPVLAEYAKLHDALARDTMEGVPAAATKLQTLAKTLAAPAGFPELPKQLGTSAKALAAAKDLEQARAAFKELSAPLVAWAQKTKAPGVVAIHCSMANGSWLQTSAAVRNPYYGSSMLTCGEVLGPTPAAQGHGGHGGH